ncbi:MAG: chemotaxis protein CheW [Granulosicoccaceae bacterium]|jgi:twitching motility protein PilI
MADTATKPDPLALLADIDQRSRAHAAGLPQQEDFKSSALAVGFRIGGISLVTPVGEVAELLTYPHMSRVPGTKSWVKGIANVRGNLLPIMDLKDYLTREPTRVDLRSRVLVVNHEGVFAGLLVEEVMGLRHYYDEDFSRKLPECDNFLKSYLVGTYSQEGQELGVFSMHALAKSPLFLQAAL